MVSVTKVAPMGDPMELLLRGYSLTLRKEDAQEHHRRGGARMILALAGNQNCGKTTLFNQLTGSNQHVGNFPGVTVEQKSGQVRGQKSCTVVDLPGIYSLRPYTAEEIVTRDLYPAARSRTASSTSSTRRIWSAISI